MKAGRINQFNNETSSLLKIISMYCCGGARPIFYVGKVYFVRLSQEALLEARLKSYEKGHV